MNFTHLHNHTEYSLLDGLSSIDMYIKEAQANNFDSLAITDHGNMHGVVDFYRKCLDAKIHPVIGCEFYATPFGTDHTDKTRSASHMLILAQNQIGYNNIMELAGLSYDQGKYYKPRITTQWLEKYSSGLIVTSGCMAAHIPSAISSGNLLEAGKMVSWYKNVFDDRFYIELQYHPGIPELNNINKVLLKFAKQFDIKCILTNDSHYARKQDAIAHDILLCVQTQQSINKPNRFKFTDDEYYLKSAEEMLNTFLPYLPEKDILVYAQNSYKLAHSTNVNPCTNVNPHIPQIILPSGESADSFLRKLVYQCVYNIYPDFNSRSDVKSQIEEELTVIKDTNFANYFLIIWDICNYAKSQKITFNTRGSAAGSIVNYIIGVSMVDPIENKLMFSRFLNTIPTLKFIDLGI